MTVHVSIMTKEILDALEDALARDGLENEKWIIDCTFGGGGHTAAMMEKFSERFPNLKFLGIDQDSQAIDRGRERFTVEIAGGKLELIHSTFAEALKNFNRPVIGLIADLGISSDQLDTDSRGFSFLSDAPLDMRMDPSAGVSAANLLTDISERELEQGLREYGNERFARSISRRIVQAIKEGNAPKTTKELVAIVVRAVPPKARHGKIHVATRTFQALRIMVNHELDQLKELLEHAIISLSPGGRICIISFHSGEDRMVKRAFREYGKGNYEVVTKRPLIPGDEEIQTNPRARSAKLRVIERLV